MLIDATLQIAEFAVAELEDYIQISLGLGLPIPVSGNQAMMLPLFAFRFGMGKEAALTHGQEMVDAANELPDPEKKSDIVVASSMAGVDNVVKAAEKFKKGK